MTTHEKCMQNFKVLNSEDFELHNTDIDLHIEILKCIFFNFY